MRTHFFAGSVIVLKGSNNLEKRLRKARWAHLTPAPWWGHHHAHVGTAFRFASSFAEVAYLCLMCDLLDISFQVADLTCIAANTIEDSQCLHFSILYWHSVSRCCARLTLVTSWPHSECTQGTERKSHTVSWAYQMYTRKKYSCYGIQKVLIQVLAIWLGVINLTATLLYLPLKDQINKLYKQTNLFSFLLLPLDS